MNYREGSREREAQKVQKMRHPSAVEMGFSGKKAGNVSGFGAFKKRQQSERRRTRTKSFFKHVNCYHRDFHSTLQTVSSLSFSVAYFYVVLWQPYCHVVVSPRLHLLRSDDPVVVDRVKLEDGSQMGVAGVPTAKDQKGLRKLSVSKGLIYIPSNPTGPETYGIRIRKWKVNYLHCCSIAHSIGQLWALSPVFRQTNDMKVPS